MPNVSLPDGRGQQQGWLQVDKKVHQKMWKFGLKTQRRYLSCTSSPAVFTEAQTG